MTATPDGCARTGSEGRAARGRPRRWPALTALGFLLALAPGACATVIPPEVICPPDIDVIYASGQAATCDSVGLACPIGLHDACHDYDGVAVCGVDGWLFHTTGDDRCCPAAEPRPDGACDDARDPGHLCTYRVEPCTSGPCSVTLACDEGTWCVYIGEVKPGAHACP